MGKERRVEEKISSRKGRLETIIPTYQKYTRKLEKKHRKDDVFHYVGVENRPGINVRLWFVIGTFVMDELDRYMYGKYILAGFRVSYYHQQDVSIAERLGSAAIRGLM